MALTPLQACELAEGRDDWYVVIGNYACGPLSKTEARSQLAGSLEAGHKAKLLRVVEDYES